jgi:hypothetical protein
VNHALRTHMTRFKERLQVCAWLLLLAVAVVARADAQVVARVVAGVDSVGVTVSDMDRSLEFYTKTLPFERVSGREVSGDDYEHL